MAKYTVHIQLHEAGGPDYDQLQSMLQKARFRFIKRLMPVGTVEFAANTSASIHDLTQHVMRAITRTGKKFSFTILKEKAVLAPRRQADLK